MSFSPTPYPVHHCSCWLLLPISCCVNTPAHRASWPSRRTAMFDCTATSCCSAVPAVGLLGFSVNPGPLRNSLHPAPMAVSARTVTAFRYVFIFRSSRPLVVEVELHDPRMGQRRIEPVDTPVRVLRATQVHFGIVARVLGPQPEVPARHLHVDLPHPGDAADPATPEGIAERDFTQARKRRVLEPRADRTTSRALPTAGGDRGAAEPALTQHDGHTLARPNDLAIEIVAG